MDSLSNNEINVPVVSAIIERYRDGEQEVLMQTRWKPDNDAKYSGMLEVPAGKIRRYENVYDALRREVFEETGLTVIRIKPEIKTDVYGYMNDGAFTFIPFCCQQQIKGGMPWIGFVFLCEVTDSIPHPQKDEVRDIHWVSKSKLENIVNLSPESIFTLQLSSLIYYLNYKD